MTGIWKAANRRTRPIPTQKSPLVTTASKLSRPEKEVTRSPPP